MALAGVHIGCWVLFGTERVNSIRDLKGKTVAITALGSGEHVTLSTMVAYVGLNPNTDINWTILPQPEAQQRFTDGKLVPFSPFPRWRRNSRRKRSGTLLSTV
jgi:NitT/TauT family transport system substrate-binding protein